LGRTETPHWKFNKVAGIREKKNKVAAKIGEIKRSRFVYKPNFWSWGKVWRFLLAPAHAHSLGTELQLQSMASINLSRAAVVALLFGRISHAYFLFLSFQSIHRNNMNSEFFCSCEF